MNQNLIALIRKILNCLNKDYNITVSRDNSGQINANKFRTEQHIFNCGVMEGFNACSNDSIQYAINRENKT